MFIVFDEAVEQTLFALAESGQMGGVRRLAELSAALNEVESLITVSVPGVDAPYLPIRPGRPLLCFGAILDAGQDPARPDGAGIPAGSSLLLLGVTEDPGRSLRAFFFSAGSVTPEVCGVDVVRLETDIFSRLKGLFDTRVLESKVVCVIGVGSGGSVVASELAKAGVGNLILIDFDRLKTHNVARHVCGLADVGRFKTRAVRDVILQHNPAASVRCYEADVTGDDELLEQVVSESDLVMVATDSELSRYLINEACLAAGKPAVYGGAYERAFAGEIIRVIPGAAGCYACVRSGLADTVRSVSAEGVFDYTEDTEFQAEPGLGLDVAFIAMIHAKVGLMTLMRGAGSAIGDIDAEMVLWTNAARPGDGVLFEQPMTRYFVRIAKSEGCPACGSDSGQTTEEDSVLP